jgi:hypothetical protein
MQRVRLIIHHGGRRSVSYCDPQRVPEKVRQLLRAPKVTQVQIPGGFTHT